MSNNEPADFKTDLEFGKKWEEYASKKLKKKLPRFAMDNVSYDKRPELQRAGIDTIFSQTTAEIDVKTQRPQHIDSPNLPIETWSVAEKSKPGWFYTAENDIVVWVFANKAKTNLHKKGYFMPHSDGLVEWFNERIDEFREVEIPNNGWTTKCRLVPIDEFPAEFLVEFDPRLKTDRDTPQSDLERWTK